MYCSANTKCNFIVSMALEVTVGQTLHTSTRAALIDPTSTYSIDVYDGKIWQTQTSELKYLRKKFSEIFSIMQKYLLAQSSTFIIESLNIGIHNWSALGRRATRQVEIKSNWIFLVLRVNFVTNNWNLQESVRADVAEVSDLGGAESRSESISNYYDSVS